MNAIGTKLEFVDKGTKAHVKELSKQSVEWCTQEGHSEKYPTVGNWVSRVTDEPLPMSLWANRRESAHYPWSFPSDASLSLGAHL